MFWWWGAKHLLAEVTAALMVLSFTNTGFAAPRHGSRAEVTAQRPHGGNQGRRAATGGETIVFFRHGEKPSDGLGQLSCQGLNRALQLEAVLYKKFGKPAAIFAPDPGEQINDGGHQYYYVRPLATVEPTAIRLGMPVNTKFGYSDIKGLQDALLSPAYQSSIVFVAWEHSKLDTAVKNIIEGGGGDKSKVPSWPGNEYDWIFVVHVTQSGKAYKATFTQDAEGLNNRSTQCPSK